MTRRAGITGSDPPDGHLSVAFLTHTPPLPLASGERIRNWHLLSEIARRGWHVSLFSLLHESTAPSEADLATLRGVCEEMILAPFDVSGRVRAARVLRDIGRGRAFHQTYFLEPRAAEQCRKWLADRRFDVISVETHYMAPYVPEQLLTSALFDTHNSEARRVRTMASLSGISAKRIAARLQCGAVARNERELAGKMARLTAVSREEVAYFSALAPDRTDLVPNGVDCETHRLRDKVPAQSSILFVGSLDYDPNVDLIDYLVDEILPLVASPGARIAVVGSNPRTRVRSAAARSTLPLELTGFVPDAGPYWDAARVLVVPLRVGGGTRLKILEALARGVPVVSTSLGCEGLDLVHGKEILVADEPAEFAAHVDRLLSDDDLCHSLAVNGRATVERRFDWRIIGDAFERSLMAVAEVPGGSGGDHPPAALASRS